MPQARTRVMIVEDHEVVRAGLEPLLKREPELEVVASVGSAEEALSVLDRVVPGVVRHRTAWGPRGRRLEGLDLCGARARVHQPRARSRPGRRTGEPRDRHPPRGGRLDDVGRSRRSSLEPTRVFALINLSPFVGFSDATLARPSSAFESLTASSPALRRISPSIGSADSQAEGCASGHTRVRVIPDPIKDSLVPGSRRGQLFGCPCVVPICRDGRRSPIAASNACDDRRGSRSSARGHHLAA